MQERKFNAAAAMVVSQQTREEIKVLMNTTVKFRVLYEKRTGYCLDQLD